MMRHCFLALIALALLAGCAPANKMITLEKAYPKMYGSQRPLSIMILPPINRSTSADAKEYFSCSLFEPLCEKGYYVYPVDMVFNILKDESAYDTEVLPASALKKFHDLFGADAVLYTTIDQWDKNWHLVSGDLVVQVRYKLVSTTSDSTMWDYSGKIKVDLNSSANSGFLATIVETALKTATVDYFPYAMAINNETFRRLPYGQQHPSVNTDKKIIIPGNKYFIGTIKR